MKGDTQLTLVWVQPWHLVDFFQLLMHPWLPQQAGEPFLMVMKLHLLQFPHPIPVGHIKSTNGPNFSATPES